MLFRMIIFMMRHYSKIILLGSCWRQEAKTTSKKKQLELLVSCQTRETPLRFTLQRRAHLVSGILRIPLFAYGGEKSVKLPKLCAAIKLHALLLSALGCLARSARMDVPGDCVQIIPALLFKKKYSGSPVKKSRLLES